jgi:hypothetical protein
VSPGCGYTEYLSLTCPRCRYFSNDLEEFGGHDHESSPEFPFDEDSLQSLSGGLMASEAEEEELDRQSDTSSADHMELSLQDDPLPLAQDQERLLYEGSAWPKDSIKAAVLLLEHRCRGGKWNRQHSHLVIANLQLFLPLHAKPHIPRGPESPEMRAFRQQIVTELGPDTERIHICPKGCVAFMHDHKGLKKCPVCDQDRYDRTAVLKCLGGGGENDFNEWIQDAGRTCKHGPDAHALRVAYYLPLTPRLQRAASTGHMDHLLEYGTDMYKKACKEREGGIEEEDRVLRDLHQGSNYMRMRKEREDAFTEAIRYMGLAVSYDGANIWATNQSSSMWPLCVVVMEYPPHIRKIPGVGTFLVMLSNLTKSCGAEDSMFERLVHELRTLHNGIVLEGAKRLVAQVNVYILDTRGVEHLLRVQGAGSYCGCYRCMFFKGRTFFPTNNVVVYYNHSAWLSEEDKNLWAPVVAPNDAKLEMNQCQPEAWEPLYFERAQGPSPPPPRTQKDYMQHGRLNEAEAGPGEVGRRRRGAPEHGIHSVYKLFDSDRSPTLR